jgi:LacI family transcriptional regulator
MPITLQELAKQLNLSKGTVSRVLNRRNDDFVSEPTRQRVLKAAQEAGYRPNRTARALATGRANAIAFCTHEVTPLSLQVIKRIQRLVRNHDLDMVVYTFDRDPDDPGEQIITPPSHVDGVLTYEAHQYIQLILDGPPEAVPPLVSIGTYLIDDTDFVGTNLLPAVSQATQHLLAMGCRRIAFLEEASFNAAPDFRHQTYQHTLEEAGGQPEFITTPEGSRTAARQAIRAYVQANGCPDGILCRYDDLAIGAYRGLRDLGLRIPEDVALIGCDGIEDTEYLDPPLTTIIQPLQEMCDLAWEFLERRMESPDIPLQQAILPSKLEIRGSSQR